MTKIYKIGTLVRVRHTKPSYECYQLCGEIGTVSSVYHAGYSYGVSMNNGTVNSNSMSGLFYFKPEEISPVEIFDFRELYKRPKRNDIKKVIFNGPATIILWANGEKTVVKCQKGDAYDKEKGFAMAFMKYICGNQGNYNNIIKKYVGE